MDARPHSVVRRLPGAFRLLHRKYTAIHRQWSTPYRMLFRWAWQRKLRANLEMSDRAQRSLLDRFMFGTIAASLGGRLRYVLVCDRVLDAEVAQFFEVAASATVLPVFGFPEAGGLVSMQTMATMLQIAANGVQMELRQATQSRREPCKQSEGRPNIR